MPFAINPFTNKPDYYKTGGSGGVIPPSGGGTGLTTVSSIPGQDLISTDLGTIAYAASRGGPDFFNEIDDMSYTGTTGSDYWPWVLDATRGSGTSIIQIGDKNNPGVIRLNCGTDSDSAKGMSRANPSSGNGLGAVALSGGVFYNSWLARFPTLSTGGDTYRGYCGLIQDINLFGGDYGTDGVIFKYDSSISDNWICQCRNSDTTSSVTTSIPVGTDFAFLELMVNADGTSVQFSINGTVAATITTNIPTISLGFGYWIQKTAGNNPRFMDLDRWQAYQNLTISRF